MSSINKILKVLGAMIVVSMLSTSLMADSKQKPNTQSKTKKVVKKVVKQKTDSTTRSKKKNSDKMVHDFDGVSIDGEVKAPNGFMIKGRTPQKLMQMVDLRSNFNNNLRNSTAGVHSLVNRFNK